VGETREAEKGGVRAYGPMVAAALAVRLGGLFVSLSRLAGSLSAGALVLSGGVARSLVAGHGFGNVFADTGPTAVGISGIRLFAWQECSRLFGTYTPASDCGGARAEQRVFFAFTCIPVFLFSRARCFNWAGGR